MEFKINSIISIEAEHFWDNLDHLYVNRPLVKMDHITKELGLEFFDTAFSTVPIKWTSILRFKLIDKHKYMIAKIKYGI